MTQSQLFWALLVTALVSINGVRELYYKRWGMGTLLLAIPVAGAGCRSISGSSVMRADDVIALSEKIHNIIVEHLTDEEFNDFASPAVAMMLGQWIAQEAGDQSRIWKGIDLMIHFMEMGAAQVAADQYGGWKDHNKR